MARTPAVDATTPDSRTGGGTPTPAGTPGTVTPVSTTPRVALSPPAAKKEDDPTPGGTPTTVTPESLSPAPPHDSSKAEGNAVKSPPVLSPPMDGSHKNSSKNSAKNSSKKNGSEAELRTAVKLIEYYKLDEHGEPIREQERVSYQNMLVRYGDWSNVRVQVAAYFLLTILGVVYLGHSDEIGLIARGLPVNDGRHMHCCCEVSPAQRNLSKLAGKFAKHDWTKGVLMVITLVVGGAAPLWERFLGRRKVLLAFMIASIPTSVLLMFAPAQSFAQQCCHMLLEQSCLMVLLITVSSMIEMLPYETRFLAVLNYIFAKGVVAAISALHFTSGFTFSNLGIMCLIACAIGAALVQFVIKDSICHHNIRNNVDIIETVFINQEEKLLNEKPEGDKKFHQSAARKIFEDLVYLDQDELKFSEFLKRLWRNFAMVEIILAFFQSISQGLHEFIFARDTNERFVTPIIHMNDRLLGFVLCAVLLFLLRNGLSMAFSVCAIGLGYCAQAMLLLHFLETTPSILRSTCVLLVYLPGKFVIGIGDKIFTEHAAKDLDSLGPVYVYHLIIILITMLRTRSKLPFSLYLFDLMPQFAI
ncbi:hypothetical protein PRIPAC_90758 [Pristionchus pacificus]|uniref:Uncharacterized protein n=1 Tax=Pristionchus pacificus TaxID=54126 RepID=A0A2A6B889_PRIPA|nr:hypothetical protein PRIPAC_90758 [Pristionchus pacificus]|eukprot:PDM62088.1 hypothetical protein PRIPAC_51530 [Pristionchus pacificus]